MAGRPSGTLAVPAAGTDTSGVGDTGGGPAGTGAGRRACIAQLPHAPGVYRFRDPRGRILYIGRAASLRRRVASYWSSLGDRPHLAAMVPAIARIEAVTCDSEHEAGWLERNLLERGLPPWNRTPGGQEVPVYILLDERPGSAGLTIAHLPQPSGSPRRYGPYLGGLKVRLAVSALHRVLPLAYAADGLTGSACDMARALGVSPADRLALAGAVTSVLEREPGAVAALRGELTRRRALAAQALAFEQAARLQAEIEAIDWITSEQKAALPEPDDFDVHGWADGMLICFAIRGGRLGSWTQRPCSQADAAPLVAACPAQWTRFARRNAELAARLAAVADRSP